jgi:[NiFe] hydrogenase diaphorase moiety large subunit
VAFLSDPEGFTNRLLAGSGSQPSRLLQHLHALQLRFSHIPSAAIEQLANGLGLSETHIRGVIGFYAFLYESPRGVYDILFSDNITDQMLGNRSLLRDLCDRLSVKAGIPRADGRVTVATTSCTGMCDQGPALLVNGRAVTRLDSRRIGEIADLVEGQTPLEAWPADYFRIDDNIQRTDLLLSSEPASGESLSKLTSVGPEQLLQEMESSGLRGRGGAGFKTGMKWRFCRQAEAGPGDKDRVVVCNADEGEPGTFKDRVLLDSRAEDLFEGMTLCAGVIGAKQGYIYLRGEYLYMRERLEQLLQKQREAGLLGRNIQSRAGFDFDIEIHMGAGAYICGEESALIESLEGKRGVPRKRPPFPVTSGYLDQPTVVNNVETFVAAALIAKHGADWFRSVGTDESCGTKLLSISGDCNRPGIYEYPFGVTIQQILDDCGADDTQAVQVAGAAGATIPPEEFGRRIAFEDVPTGGSFMVLDATRDLFDMVRNFAHFFVHESCGFCTPCRVGGSLLKDLVDKIHAGHGSSYDLEELRAIGGLMQTGSFCGLGGTAANHVMDTLDKFPQLYQNRLSHKSYEPAFDLDAALQQARDITGRQDAGAHIGSKP